MKPTPRQQAKIDQIIAEEVQAGLRARQEKQGLLQQSELNELRLGGAEALREGIEGDLVESLKQAIDDLVSEFVRSNKWNRGVELAVGAGRQGWGEAVKAASIDLKEFVDGAVREVEQHLMEGMYSPVDDAV
jgi:hypothetical protein